MLMLAGGVRVETRAVGRGEIDDEEREVRIRGDAVGGEVFHAVADDGDGVGARGGGGPIAARRCEGRCKSRCCRRPSRCSR